MPTTSVPSELDFVAANPPPTSSIDTTTLQGLVSSLQNDVAAIAVAVATQQGTAAAIVAAQQADATAQSNLAQAYAQRDHDLQLAQAQLNTLFANPPTPASAWQLASTRKRRPKS